ncbi:MAG TPA: hypothetical protein VLQ65_12270 [Saliniramus sp.]|nr:hypothetical protein [Saliniramus sp.]
MTSFSESRLDEWRDDFTSFNYDFRRFCFEHFRVHGLDATFVPNVLDQIHERWRDTCRQWLEAEVDDRTQRLSHVKICGILLYCLVKEPFLGNLYDHVYADGTTHSFVGTPAQQKAARQDLVDAREAVLALDFVLLVINWFEHYRTDRSEPYRQPLTDDMRHDLLRYLINDETSPKSLYLILKAMYLRPGHGAVN